MPSKKRTFRQYIRGTRKYKEWKNNILKQFDNKCWVSGSIGNLDVHHLDYNYDDVVSKVCNKFNVPSTTLTGKIPKVVLNDMITMFWKLHSSTRGVPLSKSLHKQFHKMYGNKLNNIDQLKRFKSDYLGGLE